MDGSVKRKPANSKGDARTALDSFGVDAVCSAIAERSSLTSIAEDQIGVSIGSLLAWIESDPERSARVREARSAMARVWDEQAEAEIRLADNDLSLRKAKELAHHYRWRASKVSKEYGDRLTHAGDPEAPIAVDASVTVEPGEAYLRMLNGGH